MHSTSKFAIIVLGKCECLSVYVFFHVLLMCALAVFIQLLQPRACDGSLGGTQATLEMPSETPQVSWL